LAVCRLGLFFCSDTVLQNSGTVDFELYVDNTSAARHYWGQSAALGLRNLSGLHQSDMLPRNTQTGRGGGEAATG
jgi:hypothetical protein